MQYYQTLSWNWLTWACPSFRQHPAGGPPSWLTISLTGLGRSRSSPFSRWSCHGECILLLSPSSPQSSALWFLFGTSLLEGRVGRSDRQGAVEGEEKAYLASCWPSKLGSVGSGKGLAVWSLVLAACSIGSKGGFEEEKSSPCSQLFQNPYSNFHSLAVILHTFLFTQLSVLDPDLAFQLHPSNLLILIPNLCSQSVQFSAVDSLRPHGLQHARPPCPSPTWSLLKLMSIESVMPSNYLILCCPLLPPSIFPSIRVFSNKSGGQSIGVHQSFQWVFRTDFL